ncbi:MAG: protein kinase [Vicinamibacterales bacterium]
MTPGQWRRVRDLFEQCVDLPLPDAEVWLRAQAEPPEVVDEVRSLVRHHSRAGAFLDAPVLEAASDLLADEERFEPGHAIGAYVIRKPLGRGGMGHVYLASDTRLGRNVALKVLAPHLVRDPSQRERLRREARAAALLSHPGICTVFALEEFGDEVVIATEYVEGRLLREEIARDERPDPEAVLRTAHELAAALDAAHLHRITHRDLKPENIIRASNGTLKILDFGLALVDETAAAALDTPRVTTPGTLVGTPAYMAPEQLNGLRTDARTDLFAFGLVLYEYATGVHPFAAPTPLATTARILEAEPRPLSAVRPDLLPPLIAAVERCLRKRPAERFASASELLTALHATEEPRDVVPGVVGWWRTHMVSLFLLYTAAIVAGWFVKEWERSWADAVFVLLAMLGTAGGMLRGHLLFAEHTHDRATFLRELARSHLPLATIDLVMSASLLGIGVWAARTRSVAGALIIGLGVGLALARLVLERSTTEAAFGPD